MGKTEALELHKDLYRADFKDYHNRVINCIGVEKWLELADKAVREGKDAGRYFSYLIKLEMSEYNRQKQNFKQQAK